MSKRRFAVLAGVLGAAAVLAAATAPELPPGPMQKKATTACTECHDSGMLVQQRLSKDGWTKEVDKMMKWGALVAPEDRQPLIDYLAANFGPDKPPLTGSPYGKNGNADSTKGNSKARRPATPPK